MFFWRLRDVVFFLVRMMDSFCSMILFLLNIEVKLKKYIVIKMIY